MKILMGREQFINSEQLKEMQKKKLRKEFWRENIQILSVGIIGGTVGAFALIGAMFMAGWC